MKNYIKGIITGIIIGAAVCSIPALADTIDALFNEVRISVNGIDEIQWDENITLADGAETPASILYNGTTYLPMRKLGEISGSKIYWNGDSRTVGMTSQQKDIKVLAEKPDKNGNVWKYYTFKDNIGYSYLGVKDEARGYERVYRVSSDMHVTDNEIYFIKYGTRTDSDGYRIDTGSITRLSFDNDPDTQDGEEIKLISNFSNGGGILDSQYACYPLAAGSNLWVYNYITGEEYNYNDVALNHLYISDIESTDNEIIFKYDSIYTLLYETAIVFDKTTNTFVK